MEHLRTLTGQWELVDRGRKTGHRGPPNQWWTFHRCFCSLWYHPSWIQRASTQKCSLGMQRMNLEEKLSLFSPRSQKKKIIIFNLLMFREIPCIGFAFFWSLLPQPLAIPQSHRTTVEVSRHLKLRESGMIFSKKRNHSSRNKRIKRGPQGIRNCQISERRELKGTYHKVVY